jgi:hypothetical protein
VTVTSDNPDLGEVEGRTNVSGERLVALGPL